MPAKKESHTGFRNGDLFCFHCGTSQKMPMPLPVNLASEWMMGFAKIHKDCKKTWVEPVNIPTDKTEEQNANWWLTYGEHGTSSKTMFKYLNNGYHFQIQNESHPYDPDDFRRCYLLLKSVPQFRAKLGRMKSVSRQWSNLVDSWDKLTEMLEEQMMYIEKGDRKKASNGMYEFMQTLIN